MAQIIPTHGNDAPHQTFLKVTKVEPTSDLKTRL